MWQKTHFRKSILAEFSLFGAGAGTGGWEIVGKFENIFQSSRWESVRKPTRSEPSRQAA